MTAIRTIAIGLPDDPAASIYDVLTALNLAVGQLGASGDFQSAAIISNLVGLIPVPPTPRGYTLLPYQPRPQGATRATFPQTLVD